MVFQNIATKLSVKAFISANLKNKDTINSLYIRVVYNKKNTSIPYYKLVFDANFDTNIIINESTNLYEYEVIALENVKKIMSFMSYYRKDDIKNLSNVVEKLNFNVSTGIKNMVYDVVEKEVLTLFDEDKNNSVISIGYIYILKQYYKEFAKSNVTLFDYIFKPNLSIIKLINEKINLSLTDTEVLTKPFDGVHSVGIGSKIEEYIIN